MGAAVIRGVTAAPTAAPEILPPDLTSPDAVISTAAMHAPTPPHVVISALTKTAPAKTVTVSTVTPPPAPPRSPSLNCPSKIPISVAGIRIPSIAVSSRDVISVGLHADHTLVTPPLSAVGELGWYCFSPVPGATGPSVVLAHDEQQRHHGLFWSLSQVQVGDVVELDRSDGQTATFRVTRNMTVPKANFPQYSQVVYGETPGPELRVITCSGLTSQEVVFADLVSLSPTTASSGH